MRLRLIGLGIVLYAALIVALIVFWRVYAALTVCLL